MLPLSLVEISLVELQLLIVLAVDSIHSIARESIPSSIAVCIFGATIEKA